MRVKRDVRSIESPRGSFIWGRQKGLHRNWQSSRIFKDILFIIAMAGRNEIFDRLQIYRSYDRNKTRRLYRRLKGGKIGIVSVTVTVLRSRDLPPLHQFSSTVWCCSLDVFYNSKNIVTVALKILIWQY